MTERASGIDSIADRRYYHFVAVSGSGVTPAGYWKRLQKFGEIVKHKTASSFGTSHFAIEHRKLRTSRAYARGQTAMLLSEHGNGRAPYYYDLFACKLDFRDTQCIVFGFPFSVLAMEMIDNLSESGFFRGTDFQGVDLSKLLSERNRPLQRFEGLASKVVGVQFVVTDDQSLTAVRLGGDDPFRAQIYESFLKRKFEQGYWLPDQCVLACERERHLSNRDMEVASLGKIVRSRVHLDKAGNFKFYMHVGCGNVHLMAYLISQISSMGCLRQVLGNPLKKVDVDETS
jgi:hypothetical protein